MSEVFISYARAERRSAEQLGRALEQAGFSVWWDHQVTAGASWANLIERQLDSAACVIVLWSANSIKSNWVLEEAAYARESNKLIPVVIEDVRPPLGFGSLQAAVLMDWNGEPTHPDFLQLVAAISDLLKQRGPQGWRGRN